MKGMNCCRFSLNSRIGKWCAVIVVVPGGVIFVIAGLFLLLFGTIFSDFGFHQRCTSIVLSLMSLFIGVKSISAGVAGYAFENRQYAIASEGLYINDKKKPFYMWDEILEIAVYPFDASASGGVYDKVICCFFEPRPKEFFDKIFRNQYMYAQKNQTKFLVIDYDETIIQELSCVYHRNIVDNTIQMNGIIRNTRRT